MFEVFCCSVHLHVCAVTECLSFFNPTDMIECYYRS